MLPVIVGVDGNIVFSTPGFYGKAAGSPFLKACSSLSKLNLMKFLFVVHESPPLGYRSNCAIRAIDTKIFGAIIS